MKIVWASTCHGNLRYLYPMLILTLCISMTWSFGFTSTTTKRMIIGNYIHTPSTTYSSTTYCNHHFPRQEGTRLLKSLQDHDEVDVDDDVETNQLFSNVGMVLLAGGTGSRMKANLPKQFLTLAGIPVLHHSLTLFLEKLPFPKVALVLDPLYHADYQCWLDRYPGRLVLANPGKERQDSVQQGLDAIVKEDVDKNFQYVAIHDSARPLVTLSEIRHVIQDAKKYGAAVLGVPCKATIKEVDSSTTSNRVVQTLNRSRLWEIQTPQVIEIPKLIRGFAHVRENNLDVTDDGSVVEALGEMVQVTLGEYTNLKLTTPEDMDVAELILSKR
jgi:2-C-methyl-D-erythritol 4-phosphate cytidylyltransferase